MSRNVNHEIANKRELVQRYHSLAERTARKSRTRIALLPIPLGTVKARLLLALGKAGKLKDDDAKR